MTPHDHGVRVVKIDGSGVHETDVVRLSVGVNGSGIHPLHSTAGKSPIPTPGASRATMLVIAQGDQDAFDRFVTERFGTHADPERPGWHHTPTLDYAIVLDGTVELQTDAGSTILRSGDAAVLEGAPHRWVVVDQTTARIHCVLTGPAR